MNYYQNYQLDLTNSRKKTLLLELNKKSLVSFEDNFLEENLVNESNLSLGNKIALLTAQEIYNNPIKNGKLTNLIYLDSNNIDDNSKSHLLEQLIEQIDDSLKTIYNIEIGKEIIKTSLFFSTKGLSNLFENYIDKGLDKTIDFISNTITNELSNNILDKVLDKTVNFTSSEIQDKIISKLSDTTKNLLSGISNKSIYLSNESKERLLVSTKKINNDLSNSQLYELILKIIIDIAIDMPIVIYVNNPQKLDTTSISILSLLLSVSKNLKDDNKHTGVSVVYAYDDEDFQPYGQWDEKYKTTQKLLDEQRIFAQRYSMLERPSSDIPTVAVKSHVFVGRKNELKDLKNSYYYSKENKYIGTMSVVSADPGVGKTKLVKKHFEQIRKEEEKDEFIIQLTLLNSVGHGSVNTGLASLTSSILEEAQRVDSIKTLLQKSSDFIVDKTKESIIDTIKDIFGDNTIDTIEAVNNRTKLDQKIKIFSQINLEKNKNEDSKEKQFENLNLAIKKLEDITDGSMPIVLFVDDLQWIDETSAEYILTHFIKKFNVHIVSTIRSSDATTMLKDAIKNISLNEYKVALLEKADILVDNKINSQIDFSEILSSSDKTDFISKTIKLKGLDNKTLTELISNVVIGEEKQQESLSNFIIESLEDNNDKGTVRTLFAIETINMLCDEQFYRNLDEKGSKLIISNNEDEIFSFNPSVKNFEENLKNTFEDLKTHYEKSFNHPSNVELGSFNLMAYAVLEERLNILRIYFAQYGNAAVNTLLFSSLLGTPFNSNIVKNVLEKLSRLEGLEEGTKELLKPISTYIKKDKQECSLKAEHYEIIDEIYEILSRHISFKDNYQARHNLLHLFLSKQLDYLLDDTLNLDKTAKNELYKLIIESIHTVTNELNNNYYTVRCTNYVLNKAIKNSKEVWQYEYAKNTNLLADLSLKNYHSYNNFLKLNKTALRNFEELNNNKKYFKEIINNKLSLSQFYHSNEKIEDCYSLRLEIKNIVENLYNKDKEVWLTKYIQSLLDLAISYYDYRKNDEAIQLEKLAYKTIKKANFKANDELTLAYINTVNTLGYNLWRQGIGKNEYFEELKTLITKLYRKNKEKWKEEYILIIYNYAASLSQQEKFDSALYYYFKVFEIIKLDFKSNPSLKLLQYTNLLINIGYSYYETQVNYEKSLEYFSMAYNEVLKYKDNHIIYYRNIYLNVCSNYGVCLSHKDKKKAINILTETIAISKELATIYPQRWFATYLDELDNLIDIYLLGPLEDSTKKEVILINNKRISELVKFYESYPNSNDLLNDISHSITEKFVSINEKEYAISFLNNMIELLKKHKYKNWELVLNNFKMGKNYINSHI